MSRVVKNRIIQNTPLAAAIVECRLGEEKPSAHAPISRSGLM